MSRCRRRCSLVWLFCVCLVALVFVLYPRQRLLLDRAHPVVSFGSAPYDHTYFWLSPSQLLLMTWKFSHLEPVAFSAVQLDTIRGTRHALPWLVKRLTQYGGTPCDFSLSPDGKWLLWYNSETMDGFGTAVAVTLDGKRSLDWDCNRSTALYWIDNRHWIGDRRTHLADTPGYDGDAGAYGPEYRRLIVRNVAAPKEAVHLRERSPAMKNLLAQTHAFNLPWYDSKYNDESANLTSLDVITYTSRLEHRAVRTQNIPLPYPSQIGAAEVAPQGDRLFLYLKTDAISPLKVWLHRWLPAYKASRQTTRELWECRRDGSDRHLIGSVLAPPKDANDEGISDVRWLPDGKHLSFVYEGRLYMVLAD